ncbi:hypothetical protein FSP39_008252 [Pinctada imbricata]|uniref:3-oxoacyl-[acyl-carrier-protein] reductase n=1 Tax=Pinctada imbricata TaxID=66713 RepID=A0AA88Y5Y8_PINIB|nr:hypothetical protein FSP39_008252 [Pinctada imbricata]
MSLSGKAALVTGSTSGIGLGIAVALARNGCDVVVTGSRSEAAAQDAVAKVKASSQSRVVYKQCDLKDTSATEEFAKEVLQDFPNGIDILVNNAGMQYVSEVSNIPLDKWNDMLAVNITAPFIFSKYFVPKMKEKGWGRVVNISSVQAIIAHPNKTPYVTTKSGLTGFTRALAMETARHGITVNALCPAWTDTPRKSHNVINLMTSWASFPER